ncbi:MAG: hypothetical protein ACOYN9_17110, partial [Saprospiraceae bacterium]
MKKLSLLLVAISLVACNRHTNLPSKMAHFTIPFESNDNQTLTYQEAIACYERMAAANPGIFKLSTVGSTDSGEPIHVAVFNTSGEFDPEKIRQSGKRMPLGEP